MKAKLKFDGVEYTVKIKKETYVSTGALALQATITGGLEEPEDSFMLSVNLPMLSEDLEKDQCYFKTWSENEGILEQLEEQGVVKRLNASAHTGYTTCTAPLVQVLF